MSYYDYATYYDAYGPNGYADDRDDSNDPEYRDPDGYCEHGTYVGGCGIDWICGYCEDGISMAELRKINRERALARTRTYAKQAEDILNLLLAHGVSGIDAIETVERMSYVVNPRARYGRH